MDFVFCSLKFTKVGLFVIPDSHCSQTGNDCEVHEENRESFLVKKNHKNSEKYENELSRYNYSLKIYRYVQPSR
jgi:hypothetical protein